MVIESLLTRRRSSDALAVSGCGSELLQLEPVGSVFDSDAVLFAMVEPV
jgi:hypothetical protein